jgi:WD40 repeat protein
MEQLETLLAVSETHQDDLEFFRKRWAPGTCHWVLSNPSFRRWVDEREDGSAMLWLHALPASGKSILSSFIVNHLLRNSVCLYYFFRFGAESKRSLSNCLRTIAFQAAAKLPQFRRALKDTRFTTKTLEKTDPKTIWEKIFIGILFKMKFPTTLYWIIDALDESDHPQLLLDLMQSIPQSSTPIRALLVSRQTPDLISTFERLSIIVPVVYLPLEETKKDIRTYVEKEVQFFHASAEFKSNIVEKLLAGAIGNFLWASLALVEVGRCNTQEDLDETLEGIPSGMEQLYQRMESTIIDNNKRPRDQKLGQMILTWAACSRRPLVLKELEQALQPEFDVKIDLKFTISRVCGQFVIVDDTDQLVMVHQTARDHITTTKSPLGVDVEEGHERIFAKCLSVLEEKHQRRELDRRGTNQKATENQEFLRYATTDWAYHLNMTSPRSDAPLSLLTKFLRGNSVLGWIASLAQENQLKVLVYSSKHLNLYVRRKSGRYVATNPLLHRLRDLDLLESWATDFLKILGKFGRNLSASPASIYEQIPPFCPKHSQIYTLFKQKTPVPHPVAVEGVSNPVWDDSLAKLSLGSGSRALAILCSGDHLAVLTSSGAIVLFKSVTFEIRRTLTHGEQVCAMSFSTCSNMFVTYGFRTTKVWHVKTGRIKHQIRNPMGSRAFTIAFSASCTQLIIGSNDRLIRVARLTDANPAWSLLHPDLLKADTVLDRPVHNVPWRIAFNCDSNYVAVSYRGAPLCVWALDPPELIGRCMRNQEYAGNSWTVVDQVIWHAKSEEVLGLYLGGHVFRWNPFNDTQQELQAAASILASSPEGKFFAIGDCNGTIKLYNFHHFALIYQLSCEGMMDDICFSPDSKRLYDVRGQFCNIWEPNALLRVDEAGEQDNEVGSEAASIPTCSVSESFSEMRDQITAVAIQFRGRYHAIGNAIGLVSVVDSLEGDHVGIELWRSPVSLSIEHLSWSCDGTHLACAELTGKVVVKSVLLENDQKWSVLPTFGVKLKVSSEGIRQVLLNQNGKALLVKNGPSVTVWSQTEQSSELKQISLESSDAKWSKHPTDSNLLLAFRPFSLQVYLWDDLSEVALFNLDRPQFGPSLGICRTSDHIEHPSSAFRINSVFTNPAGSHFLMDAVVDTCTGEEHLASLFEDPAGSSLTPSAGKRPCSTITEVSIPTEIQDQVEIPLGILPVKRLIFLDKDYWVCSWRLGGNLITEKIQKYYFLPKDWLNVDCLDLCALLADGRFLIPHNGELAVIKSTGMSHW